MSVPHSSPYSQISGTAIEFDNFHYKQRFTSEDQNFTSSYIPELERRHYIPRHTPEGDQPRYTPEGRHGKIPRYTPVQQDFTQHGQRFTPEQQQRAHYITSPEERQDRRTSPEAQGFTAEEQYQEEQHVESDRRKPRRKHPLHTEASASSTYSKNLELWRQAIKQGREAPSILLFGSTEFLEHTVTKLSVHLKDVLELRKRGVFLLVDGEIEDNFRSMKKKLLQVTNCSTGHPHNPGPNQGHHSGANPNRNHHHPAFSSTVFPTISTRCSKRYIRPNSITKESGVTIVAMLNTLVHNSQEYSIEELKSCFSQKLNHVNSNVLPPNLGVMVYAEGTSITQVPSVATMRNQSSNQSNGSLSGSPNALNRYMLGQLKKLEHERFIKYSSKNPMKNADTWQNTISPEEEKQFLNKLEEKLERDNERELDIEYGCTEYHARRKNSLYSYTTSGLVVTKTQRLEGLLDRLQNLTELIEYEN